MDIDSKQIRFLSRMGSRGAFGEAVYQLAKEGMDFFTVTADMGRPSGFERIARDFPEKYIDVGIAEQNMLGVAAGLAKDGTPVIVSTMAAFSTMRCADQVKNYIGQMGLNIKVVGLDSGFTQSLLGASHFALEDLSFMRSVPGMRIYTPSDGTEIALCVEEMMKTAGPAYLRLTGSSPIKPVYTAENIPYDLKSIHCLRRSESNSGILIIGIGSVLSEALSAAESLSECGIDCSVYSAPSFKPFDEKALDGFAESRIIFTVEEHFVSGGLGTVICEYYADKAKRPLVKRIGTGDCYPLPGSHGYILHETGLDSEGISKAIKMYASEMDEK